MFTKLNGSCSTSGHITVIDILIITSLWCISLFIINPLGNFPLNDDWSYGLTVKHLIENGVFCPPGWVSTQLITNVLWGSLFCLPFGFSFTALRLSTLILSLVGIIGVYVLIRDQQQPRWLAVITALTFGFNPIYYALSNTFMTDVPYTAITILAAVFFARSLRKGSDLDLLIGTTLAVAATLSRQLAISVPLAFAISLIVTRGFTKRDSLRAAIPLIICLGALLVYQQWLEGNGLLPALYYARTEDLLHVFRNPKQLVLSLPINTFKGLLYLGWFLLPVLIFIVVDILRSHRKQAIALLTFTIGTMVLIGGVRTLFGKDPIIMPISRNILNKSGIGPLSLHDTYILGLNHVPALPMSFWFVITAMSFLGAAFLLTALGVHAIQLVLKRWLGGKISDNEAVGIFLLLSAMIYLLPLFASNFYDRYLVPTIPFFAAGIVGVSGHFPRFRLVKKKPLHFAAIALLTVFSLFAIGSTRDYLAWNRIRWEALNELMENNHVHVEDIDGGFEFNGFYLYDPHYQPDSRKSWWWVKRDIYQIDFQNIPGYKIVKEYSYPLWIPPHVGKLVMIQKYPQYGRRDINLIPSKIL